MLFYNDNMHWVLLFYFQAIILDDEEAFQGALVKLIETPNSLDVIEVHKRVLLYKGEKLDYGHGMCLLAYAGYFKRIAMIDKLVESGARKQDAICIICYHNTQ